MGIWFAIGLTHPEATSTLIHNFVFGWAMEWVFFIVELTTAAVYYYTWNRIDAKLHLKVGWVYAGASAATLIIINGILAVHADAGRHLAWRGRHRPRGQQILERLLQSHVLAEPAAAHLRLRFAGRNLGADHAPAASTATSSRRSKPAGEVEREVAGAVVRGHAVPDGLVLHHGSRIAARAAHAGHRHHQFGHFLHRHAHGAAHHHHLGDDHRVAYYLAYRNPVDFNLSHAMGVLLLALMATGAGEYSREMLRKPYVIGRWMYSNGVRVPYVSRINRRRLPGPLELGVERIGSTSYSRGEAIFRGECGSCHTLNGYRPLRQLLEGRDRANIGSFITMLHEYKPDSPYQPLYAADGGHEAGCGRSDRIS